MAKNSSKDLKRNICISKIIKLLKTNKKKINEEVFKKKGERKKESGDASPQNKIAGLCKTFISKRVLLVLLFCFPVLEISVWFRGRIQ